MEDIGMNGEHQPNLMDIHRAFAETEHGQVLAAQVRYDRYKPEEVSNERWVELLGADVNNLTHMPLTFGLTQAMIVHMDALSPRYLDDEEKDTLKVAALIHDWGEAIVGDITYSDKTAEHEEEEKTQFENILEQFGDEDAAEIRELISRAAAEVVFDPSSKLGRLFNTIERIGYVRTALRASQHVQSGSAPECERGMTWLIADVLANHTSALLERINEHPPIYFYLANQMEFIKSAFKLVHPGVFELYPPEQTHVKCDAFYAAKTEFEIWFR